MPSPGVTSAPNQLSLGVKLPPTTHHPCDFCSHLYRFYKVLPNSWAASMVTHECAGVRGPVLGVRASLGEVVRPESGAQGTSLGGARGSLPWSESPRPTGEFVSHRKVPPPRGPVTSESDISAALPSAKVPQTGQLNRNVTSHGSGAWKSKITVTRGFPGGPAVKTSRRCCWECKFHPWSRN